MEPVRSKNRYTYQVGVLFLVAAVILLGAVFYLGNAQRRQAEASAREKALSVLRSVSAVHQRAIEGTGQLLEVLSYVPAVRQLDAASCSGILESILQKNPYLANLGLIDTEGNLLCSAVPFQEPVNVSDRLYFQKAFSSRRLAVGEYALGRISGKPSLHLGFPVMDEKGNVKGVLYAALDLSCLAAAAAEFSLPEGAVFTVFDHNGIVLARFPDGLKWLGQKMAWSELPGESLLTEGEEKVFWEENEAGRVLLALLPLGKPADAARIMASLSIPEATVYAEVAKTSVRSFWALGLSMLFLAGALLVGGRGLFLARKAEREAAAAEGKYRILFENTGAATVLIEEDTTISLVNEEFARLVGLSREEIEGKKSWKEFVAEERDLRRMEEYHRLRRVAPGLAPRNYEARLRDRDGKARHAYFTVNLLPCTAQSIVSIVDLTEQKESEQRLQRRLKLEELIARASSRFLREEFDRAVDATLAEIGRFAGAGRAYLFLINDEKETMDNTHEWCAPEVSPQKENLQNLPCAVFPWWMEKLRAGEVIHVVDVEQMPPEAQAEKEILQSQDIKSLLVLPVCCENKLAGFIGLDNVEAPGEWREEDILLLRLGAEIFGGALERTRLLQRQMAAAEENARLYREAQERLRQLQTLHGVDAMILGSMDLHLTLEVLLTHVVEQLGADAAAVLLLDRQEKKLEPVAVRGINAAALREKALLKGENCTDWKSGRETAVRVLALEKAGCKRAAYLREKGFAACASVPLIARGELKGVLELVFSSSPMLSPGWEDYLKTLAQQAAIAIENAQLFMEFRNSARELQEAYDHTIEALAYALDLRDKETEGHSRRVADLTVALARAMGIEGERITHLRRGALLHDIGKLGVPDSILQKPGPLTEEEWEVMRRHPVYAWEMLSSIEHLRPALDIPYCHHERWDGTGYPRGLKGKSIPLAARIFAVVDVWDALRSHRPYRPPWAEGEALAYIRNQAGRHFDPEVVQVFLSMVAQRQGQEDAGERS